MLEDPIQDVKTFVVNFIKGLKIFDNVTEFESCQPTAEMIDDLKKVADMIKSFDWNDLSKIPQLIADVTAILNDFVQRAKEVQGHCQNAAKQVEEVITKVGAYFSDPAFPQSLLYHTLGNIEEFKKRLQSLEQAFASGNIADAGLQVGDFLKFALLFNYQDTKEIAVFMEGAESTEGFKDIYHCIVAVTKDLPAFIQSVKNMIADIEAKNYEAVVAEATKLLAEITDLMNQCKDVI